MTENAFIGKKNKPTDAELRDALGPSKAVWDQLLTELAGEHGLDIREWKGPLSPKWGWALRVKLKKRTIVWLSPFTGCFEVLFIFSAKAMSASQQCALPKHVVEALRAAPKYPEGTGLRLKVKTLRALGALRKLVAIKLAN
ncbi:MAG: DUF3788 family protein [Verrucomicrobiota bacterium]